MVEPAGLAATAVALLTPYLQRLAGRVVEHAADAIADEALPAVQRLYDTLRVRLRPGTYAANQLQGVEESPDSDGRQQALRAALVEELEDDPAFAAEIERLVNDTQEAGGVQIRVTDTGIVAGRDVNQRGRYVAGRDMTVGGTHAEQS